MSVTTVIVTYNSNRHIEASVRAALAQPANDAVVVVDNASSDETVGTVTRLAATDARLSLVHSGGNVGFGVASNLGARGARTPYVLMLNPDTVMAPGALDAMLAVAAEPGVGIVGPRLVLADGSPDPAGARRAPTVRDAFLYCLPAARARSRSRYHVLEPGTHVEAVSGACMLLPTDLYAELGGFSPAYWMYGEDLDLCAQVRARGRSVRYAGNATVVHQKGGSSGRYRTVRVNAAFHRAQWTYYRRNLMHRHNPATSAAVLTGVVCTGLARTVHDSARRQLAA